MNEMMNANVLAAAVLHRAVLDYKGYLKHFATQVEYKKSSIQGLIALEQFFRSPWCDILCDLCGYENGLCLMRMCQQDADRRWKRRRNP